MRHRIGAERSGAHIPIMVRASSTAPLLMTHSSALLPTRSPLTGRRLGPTTMIRPSRLTESNLLQPMASCTIRARGSLKPVFHLFGPVTSRSVIQGSTRLIHWFHLEHARNMLLNMGRIGTTSAPAVKPRIELIIRAAALDQSPEITTCRRAPQASILVEPRHQSVVLCTEAG